MYLIAAMISGKGENLPPGRASCRPERSLSLRQRKKIQEMLRPHLIPPCPEARPEPALAGSAIS
jgi:hypothetical protein